VEVSTASFFCRQALRTVEKFLKRIHKSAVARYRKRTRTGQLFYSLRYRIGEYALRAVLRTMPWIPRRLLILATVFWAWVSFALLWKYRKRMEENVTMALGREIPDRARRKTMIWQAWKNFARGLLETCAVMHFSRERIISQVAMEGEEHLKRALAKGNGVLALSAHLGNFTMIGARLAASGYPFSVVVKHPGDERFARLIDSYRTQLGIQTISARPRRETARGILKALRENRIVLVIADEFKSEGVMVEFMGQLSAAPRGPATLALRTGAVTLPMFATRRPNGSLLLSIGTPIQPVQVENLEESVLATTALFTRHLEGAIRQHPEQWNWLGFPRNGRIPRSEYGKPPATPSQLGTAAN
jgi:KDO2-lipid IV(A) lauroyltransferase